jgi:hypothetical protein
MTTMPGHVDKTGRFACQAYWLLLPSGSWPLGSGELYTFACKLAPWQYKGSQAFFLDNLFLLHRIPSTNRTLACIPPVVSRLEHFDIEEHVLVVSSTGHRASS